MSFRALLWLGLLYLAALPAQAETVVYVHTDALGSPVLETDDHANIVRQVDYRAYGEEVMDGPKAGPGYTGHYRDVATDLVYMQQRYYDPAAGTFLSLDPVKTDPGTGALFNRYNYANNNPYRFVDPDGRLPEFAQRLMGEVPDQIDAGGSFASEQAAASVRNEVQHQIDTAPQQMADAASVVGMAFSFVTPVGRAGRVVKGGAAIAKVAFKVSQKQFRHVLGRLEYRGGGYLSSIQDAQRVLDAFHSGAAPVIGIMKNGSPVVRFGGVTGVHVNKGSGVVKETNVFMVKGTEKPSIVPINPDKKL